MYNQLICFILFYLPYALVIHFLDIHNKYAQSIKTIPPRKLKSDKQKCLFISFLLIEVHPEKWKQEDFGNGKRITTVNDIIYVYYHEMNYNARSTCKHWI